MEIPRRPTARAVLVPGLWVLGVAMGLTTACIPSSHKLLDQSRALRWQQDSLAMVVQIRKVSEGEFGQALEVARLDSVNRFLLAELETTRLQWSDQVRRADTLLDHVQNEAVVRDLVRMDLAEAQAAATLFKKRADSLLIEVEFLKQHKPIKPASAKPTPRK